MKTLKAISTAVMLITGIITALTGAVETIIKLVDKLQPVPPRPQVMEKSLRELEEIIPPATNFVFPYLGGTELIILGVILITLSIWLNNKFNN